MLSVSQGKKQETDRNDKKVTLKHEPQLILTVRSRKCFPVSCFTTYFQRPGFQAVFKHLKQVQFFNSKFYPPMPGSLFHILSSISVSVHHKHRVTGSTGERSVCRPANVPVERRRGGFFPDDNPRRPRPSPPTARFAACAQTRRFEAYI